nr:hypothetical protein [Tanacetum cinerariifolium]
MIPEVEDAQCVCFEEEKNREVEGKKVGCYDKYMLEIGGHGGQGGSKKTYILQNVWSNFIPTRITFNTSGTLLQTNCHIVHDNSYKPFEALPTYWSGASFLGDLRQIGCRGTLVVIPMILGRVIGHVMPTAELLAATAKLTETQEEVLGLDLKDVSVPIFEGRV